VRRRPRTQGVLPTGSVTTGRTVADEPRAASLRFAAGSEGSAVAVDGVTDDAGGTGMRVSRRRDRAVGACAATVLLLAACSSPDDEGESTTAAVEDDGGGAEDADASDGGSDQGTGSGGAGDAGERPQSDFALAEEQREEFLSASELETTGTIGSSTDRIGDLESRYDATATEEAETQLTVPDDVLFDFDSDELRPEAADVLDEVAEIIDSYEGAAVEVVGHTDDIGATRYNQDLSERRSAAVVRYLVDQSGVDADRLASRGVGASEPLEPNANDDGSDNPEGRAANRRVEVNIDG
jgi:outer membrane protein OmpA-like peptidoglycan-associated protein